jgi:multiple sugar transport system substrate-binding protein
MLLFIGCDKAPKATGDSGGAAPADKTSNTAREVVQLTYSGWGSPSEKNVTEQAIQKFNDNNPNIKVTYMHVPTDYVTKMATLAAATSCLMFSCFTRITPLNGENRGNYTILRNFLITTRKLMKAS